MASSSPSGTPSLWSRPVSPRELLLLAGGALLLAGVIVSQTWVWIRWWRLRFTIAEAALWSLPDILLWLLLIPGIVFLARRFPIERESLARRVPLHLLAAFAVSVTFLLLLYLSDQLLHWSRLMGAPPDLLSNPRYRYGFSIFTGMTIYWAVAAVTQAVGYYGRYRERDIEASYLESELARAELDALKMQLDPHFLFNTLNSISVLMRRDVDAAEKTIQSLSELLRHTLQSSGTQAVPLSQEVAFLERYLEIQRTRFRDRLNVEFALDPQVADALVPNLLLQPLIENSVVHGVARSRGPGHIWISAERDGDEVLLRVRDNGPGLAGDPFASGGIGLGNTRARLTRMYGGDHEFSIRDVPEGGTEVLIRLPLTPSEGGTR